MTISSECFRMIITLKPYQWFMRYKKTNEYIYKCTNTGYSISEPDESLRGGYMLFFVDDGEGMDPSKLKATMFKLVYRYKITIVDHTSH